MPKVEHLSVKLVKRRVDNKFHCSKKEKEEEGKEEDREEEQR